MYFDGMLEKWVILRHTTNFFAPGASISNVIVCEKKAMQRRWNSTVSQHHEYGYEEMV